MEKKKAKMQQRDIKNINRRVGESFSACICRKSSSLKVTTGRLRVPPARPERRFHHRGLREPPDSFFFFLHSLNEILFFSQQRGREPARGGLGSLETLGTY